MQTANEYFLTNFGFYLDYIISDIPHRNLLADANCPGNPDNHDGTTWDLSKCISCTEEGENVTHHADATVMTNRVRVLKTKQIAILFTEHNLCQSETIYDSNSDTYSTEHHDNIGGLQTPEGTTFNSILIVGNDSLSTLIHEIGHILNAPDHYNDNGTPSTNELNNIEDHNHDAYIDIELGIEYNEYCIYGEDHAADTTLTMCEGCKYQINKFLNGG